MSFVCTVWGNAKKAFVGSTVLILFGLLVLGLSVVAIHDKLGAFGEASGSGTGKMEYYLPYPGVLPDNPVYKLKAARDRVQLWVILDQSKKAEKELLFANKRIGAAKFLAEGGKIGLAVSTATKAEKYLESAYNRLDKLSRDGKDVKSLLIEVKKAMGKHQEILEEVLAKTSDLDRNTANETLKMNKLLQQRLEQTWVEAK